LIQAGGQTSRMGEDKALKLFLGRPLIQRAVDRLSSIANEILVATNHTEENAFLGLSLALTAAGQFPFGSADWTGG
jgi:molybdopterin-guanine dinucleotide biosynthesis protein A